MHRKIRLYFISSPSIQEDAARPRRFRLGILSFVFIQASGILFLHILVRETGRYTWTYFELLVIYAMFPGFPRGIDICFTDNRWMVGFYVRRGMFDK